MSCYTILGLRVDHRHTNAPKLQEMLTKYGCQIKMRVGLHETSETYCSDDGVIVLQVCGDEKTVQEMLTSFNALEGIKAKAMTLD